MTTQRVTARRTWIIRIVVLLVVAVVVALLVFFATRAAFSSTTQSDGSLSAGKVELTDNDANKAIFEVSNMGAGQVESRCVTVQYTGTNLPATVKLYAADDDKSAQNLGGHLDVRVEMGSYASSSANATGQPNPSDESSCDGFTVGKTIAGADEAKKTFTAFTKDHHDFATAVSAWQVTGDQNRTQVFRITMTVHDDNAAQGKTTAPTFTWEAREEVRN
jgi:hypothetical protein